MFVFLQKGDPNDNTLRKVETEVVVPQRMRDKAKEKCATEVAGIVCAVSLLILFADLPECGR